VGLVQYKQEVCQSQPRTIYELKQQIRNNFAAVDLHFLRKSVESVSSRLYPNIIKWALKQCKNFRNRIRYGKEDINIPFVCLWKDTTDCEEN